MRFNKHPLSGSTTHTRCWQKAALYAAGGLLVCMVVLKLTSVEKESLGSAAFVAAVDTTSARNHPLKKAVPLSDHASFKWPSHILEVPQREATERKGMMTPSISPRDVVAHYVASGGKLSGHIVNVGAGDGCIRAYNRECDEANEFLELAVPTIPMSDVRSRTRAIETKFKGHLYEPNEKYVAVLSTTYKNISVGGGVDASNFARILQSDGVPHNFDVLKYDTDAQDCDSILAVIDAGFQPRVVLAEFNLLFPPPVGFNLPYTKGLYTWAKRTPYAVQLGNECSLSFLSERMAARGYVLLQVDWWDALFVTSQVYQTAFSQVPIYDDLTWWLHGYVANAPSDDERAKFLSGTAFSEARTMAPERWLKQIRESSLAGRMLTFDELTQMRTDLFYFCSKGRAVQQSPKAEDGPQPFTLYR